MSYYAWALIVLLIYLVGDKIILILQHSGKLPFSDSMMAVRLTIAITVFCLGGLFLFRHCQYSTYCGDTNTSFSVLDVELYSEGDFSPNVKSQVEDSRKIQYANLLNSVSNLEYIKETYRQSINIGSYDMITMYSACNKLSLAEFIKVLSTNSPKELSTTISTQSAVYTRNTTVLKLEGLFESAKEQDGAVYILDGKKFKADINNSFDNFLGKEVSAVIQVPSTVDDNSIIDTYKIVSIKDKNINLQGGANVDSI